MKRFNISQKLNKCLVSLFFIFLASISVFAQTFNGTTTSTSTTGGAPVAGSLPITIPDSSGGCGGAITAPTTSYSCVTVPVSGISSTSTLSNITASFTVGTDPSTWIGDYGIVLRAPGGSPSLTLMGQPGNTTPFAGGCGDSTNINAGTVVTFSDSGGNLPTTVAGLSSTQTLPTGSYAPSLGTTSPNGTMGGIGGTFYGLTGTAQNGNWEMCFYDVSGTDTMSISAVSLNITQAAPTAGDGFITGKVVSSNGRPIAKAIIYLTDTNNNETYTAITNPFGYFRFKDLAVGNFYIMTVNKKGFNFDVMSFNLNEGIDSMQIIGYQN
jgi:hypothetical protein